MVTCLCLGFLKWMAKLLAVGYLSKRLALLLSASNSSSGIAKRQHCQYIKRFRNTQERLDGVHAADKANPVRPDSIGPGCEQHGLDRAAGIRNGEGSLLDCDGDCQW